MTKIRLIILSVAVLIFAALAGTGYYYFDKYQKTKNLLENPDQASKIETESVVAKVGKLMELPQGQATVATVLDKEKLKDQPFFQKAENGDKVIIYAESQTAILYRPSTNKIVAFAPVSIGEPQDQEPQATVKPSPKPTPAEE